MRPRVSAYLPSAYARATASQRGTYTALYKGLHSNSSANKWNYEYIHTHTYIPWIHRCVMKTVGCGTSHKYTYANIQLPFYKKVINL
jgi:hypothetical protein